MSSFEDKGLPKQVSPEDIFDYAYAVFHSPEYRRRYAEFLKIDFPRLPLTSSLDLFRALAGLGGELVALHLMESPKLNEHITRFVGNGNAEVEKVSFDVDAASCRVAAGIKRQDAASTAIGTVWIDKAQTTGFKGVPEEVWNFHIGGYQVCQKWLKDRKGRRLSAEDIEHYQKIVVALSETIRIMGEIDRAIDAHGGWPGAFAAEPTPSSTGEGQTGPDSIGKVSGTPVSPKPPTSSPAPTAIAPSRPVTPGKPVGDEERKSILVALDKAGETLGTPLLSVKSKIDRRRLEEILPILVRQGILKQSGTGSSARYSRG